MLSRFTRLPPHSADVSSDRTPNTFDIRVNVQYHSAFPIPIITYPIIDHWPSAVPLAVFLVLIDLSSTSPETPSPHFLLIILLQKRLGFSALCHSDPVDQTPLQITYCHPARLPLTSPTTPGYLANYTGQPNSIETPVRSGSYPGFESIVASKTRVVEDSPNTTIPFVHRFLQDKRKRWRLS